MVVQPDSQGHVHSGMRNMALERWEGYINRYGVHTGGATRLHINLDFDLTTQALNACYTPVPVIGGRAWPSLAATPDNPDHLDLWEKTLTVWMNTTLGLIGRWWVSARTQKGRANRTITTIGTIPVLDCRRLTDDQLTHIASVFDEHAQDKNARLLPANQAHRDNTRQDLDHAVLCDVLDLPPTILNPLATARRQWTHETLSQGHRK